MRAAGVRQSVGLCAMKTGRQVMWSLRFSPPQGFRSLRRRRGGGLIKRTAISILNTLQFTTVSWPHREGYAVNGLNIGDMWLHLLHPAAPCVMCEDFLFFYFFSLWHQFLCYQFFLRCLFLSSLMSADSRGGGDGTVGGSPVTDSRWSDRLGVGEPPGKWEMDVEEVGGWLFVARGSFLT